MTATAGHVFISHGSEDRDEAIALSDFIEARGIRTWIAPRNVRPGQDYSEQLQQAIEQCAAFVVLVTGKANTSPYVRAETEMAFSTNKPIFPVRQTEIQPAAGLAFFLKIRHWTDAFGKHGDSAMERLGLELDSLCGPPKPEPAPPPPPEPTPAEPTTPGFLQSIPTATPATPPTSEARIVPPTGAPAPLPAEQEERLAAAVGPSAGYYREKWRKMEASGSQLSWNWPAFLASIFWFAHRKMWVPLVAGVAFLFLADFVAGRSRAFLLPAWLFLFALAALAALSGAIGNALYRRQSLALVAKADGLDQPVALAQLRAQGGVSIPGLLTSMIIFLILIIAAFAATLNRMATAPAPIVQPSAQAQQPAPAAQADQPVAAPAPAPDEQPAPATAGVTLDSTYLLGHWTDGTGNCQSAFNNDGTFTADDGSRGYWNLTGDRLTLTGSSTLIFQVQLVDANTVTLVKPDGSLIRATRC